MSSWLGSAGGAADTWAEERRRLAQEVKLAAFAECVIGRADGSPGANAGVCEVVVSVDTRSDAMVQLVVSPRCSRGHGRSVYTGQLAL